MRKALVMMIGAGVLMTQALQAEQEVRSLYLYDIPWDFEECHEKAAAFGEAAKAYAGLDVAATQCNRDNTLGSLTMVIRYRAENPANLIATNRDYPVIGSDGFYATEEECQENLAAQVNLFEEQTSHQALLSYCAHPSTYSNRYDFFIVSIGETEVIPRNNGFYLFGAPVGHSAETFRTSVSGLLAKLGGTLAEISFRNQLANTAAVYRYYGAENIRLVEEYASRTYNADVCEGQRARFERALSEKNADLSHVLYCSKTFGAGSSMELTLLLPSNHDVEMFDTSGSTEFETLEECAAGRTSVVERFRESFGRQVVAGFCNYDYRSRQYNVKMVEIN